MKHFFRELLDYNSHFNVATIKVITDNKEIVSTQSIRLISHILNAHKIWNERINPGEAGFEPWQIHEVQSLAVFNHTNFSASVSIINTWELAKQVEWQTKEGKVFKNSVYEILFQIINHSNYHRA